MASELRIGVSGWTYDFWRGEFYPHGLPQKRELEYAGRQMSSIAAAPPDERKGYAFPDTPRKKTEAAPPSVFIGGGASCISDKWPGKAEPFGSPGGRAACDRAILDHARRDCFVEDLERDVDILLSQN